MAATFGRRPLGRSGVLVTTLGFGGGPVGNLVGPDAEAVATETIDTGWSEGIRCFDTAPLYGLANSERRIGTALASPSRDEVFVSTKVGPLLRPGGRLGP